MTLDISSNPKPLALEEIVTIVSFVASMLITQDATISISVMAITFLLFHFANMKLKLGIKHEKKK